jgi:cytoskeletal protein RodZ
LKSTSKYSDHNKSLLGDCHLYCENCVRQAQKRKVRQDQTILLKRAFQKIQEQEKVGQSNSLNFSSTILSHFNLCQSLQEFERQVAAGKFSDPIPTMPPVAPAAPTPTAAMNLSTTPSKSSSHQHNHHHNSATSANAHQHHSSSATTGSGHHNQFQQQTPTSASGQQHRGGATLSSSGHHSTPRTAQAASRPAKRPANASSNNNSNNTNANQNTSNVNAALAALSSNPLLQQQLAAMTAMRRFFVKLTNPLLGCVFNSVLWFQANSVR